MKKITLSLVAAGIAASFSANATLPTDAAPFQVVVPNLKSGAEVILEGLYVKPSNPDLEYSRYSPTSTSYDLPNIDPKFDFGFRVGLGYIIPDSGNDVQLNWTHFDQTTEDDTTAAATQITDAGTVSFRYNALDLDVGQYMSIGTRLQTRLFLGLRAIELQSDVNINNTKYNTTPPQVVRDIKEASRFRGIGPRAGIDATYNLTSGFGVAAHLAGDLLVGTSEASGSASREGGANPKAGDSNKQARVVPGIDAKLGLSYSVPFNHNASNMSIEAGYQTTQYFDVIDRMNVLPHGDDRTVVTTSNVSFNGPYLSLSFKI
jgi:hypothetical protein